MAIGGLILPGTFLLLMTAHLKAVADGRPERLAVLAKVFPSVKGVKDADDIINDTEIDAVVIATSVLQSFSPCEKSTDGRQTCADRKADDSLSCRSR